MSMPILFKTIKSLLTIVWRVFCCGDFKNDFLKF